MSETLPLHSAPSPLAGPGDDSTARASRKGVYFLANDAIYDWAVAFLESFRQYNPDVRLVHIPFDENSDRVKSLAAEYRFEIYEDPSFAELERIGYSINRGQVSYGHHWFRRFASFWGPLEEFLYIDGRTVVLCDVNEIIDARINSGFDLLHWDVSMDQVYFKGPFRDKMIRERGAHGFMSTLFVSRRGLFTLEEMTQYAVQAQDVLDQLDSRLGDQPWINFICDMKGVRVGALYYELENVVTACWSRSNPGMYRIKDRYYRWDHGKLEHNRRIPLMHWAGIRLGPIMPYARFHLGFRLRREPALTRISRRLKWALAYPPLKLIDMLHRSRHVNTLYHMLQFRLRGRELPERLCAVAKPD